MSKRLAVVEYKGKKYFLDRRLRQIRNINNPSDYKDFGDFDPSKMNLVEPEIEF